VAKVTDEITILIVQGSDIGEINISTYGRERAEFIARAIAFFGGFDSIDDLYEL